jgi:hypothetical protein
MDLTEGDHDDVSRLNQPTLNIPDGPGSAGCIKTGKSNRSGPSDTQENQHDGQQNYLRNQADAPELHIANSAASAVN